MDIMVRKSNDCLPINQVREDHHEGDIFDVYEGETQRVPSPKSVFWLLKVRNIDKEGKVSLGPSPNDLCPDGIKTWREYLIEPERIEETIDPETNEVIPPRLGLRRIRKLTSTPDTEAPYGGLTVDEAMLFAYMQEYREVEGNVGSLYKLIKNKKEE